MAPAATLDERDEVGMRAASFTPMIDISQKSLRGAGFDTKSAHITPAE